VHFDLHSGNIFLFFQDMRLHADLQIEQAVIGDLGEACPDGSIVKRKLTNRSGTCSKSEDIFRLGVLAHQMLTGIDDSYFEMGEANRIQWPAAVDSVALTCLNSMIGAYGATIPSIEQVLACEWLTAPEPVEADPVTLLPSMRPRLNIIRCPVASSRTVPPVSLPHVQPVHQSQMLRQLSDTAGSSPRRSSSPIRRPSLSTSPDHTITVSS